MARLDQKSLDAACKHLEKAKVFKIADVASVLKCSIPNARIKLKKWRACTSYNQNGKFYALPSVLKFNQYGIWQHESVAFSKYGNLKKTIVHLVTSAPAGLSGKQLGELLGLNPQSFLHHFRSCPGIHREKHDGIYVYFAENDAVYKQQEQQRNSIASQSFATSITDSEAINILIAIIKNHGISAKQILAVPEIKKSKLKLKDIQSFLEHHGLLKKTLVFRR